MKMKVSELVGPSLDYAVAIAGGHKAVIHARLSVACFRIDPETRKPYRISYRPTKHWDTAGPIIEREKITIGAPGDMGGAWVAWPGLDEYKLVTGATPLIAAMRCFVASKLGDEVEIPEEMKA